MSPVCRRELGFQRHQPEDREGLSRTRRPGRGHLGHSGGWQDIEGKHTHSAIHIPIQQKPQTRGLEGYGSISSAPTTSQRSLPMEHGKKETSAPYGNHQRLESHQTVQTPGGEGKQDKGESRHYPSYRRATDPDREYSYSFRLTRSRPNQLSSGFTPFKNQQISGQKSPFFTIPGSFQEKTRIQGQKNDLFQPKAEIFRPNDAEAVGLGERSRQEPEIVLHTSRISSPINRNITPTQIENNVDTPESNLNSDALWFKFSQFAEQTQKQFPELQASHERMKTLKASMEEIVKTLQAGHAQLRKTSEETKQRMNKVFEEQEHRKRDRDCLDQDINKQFNVYHKMRPQPKGHVMDNPYHQEDIKPDANLETKARSPSQCHRGSSK
ncbi:hypothetical protein O181_054035 [Austropuccinia psidii MF-1]|uniref:Uncharacterized protein n=1 Tax=Austropuccinia psidii MF-1 TaxID=1389203 RepID=A0A9Q3E1N8_9BASI|nr:hypothetical protein [Austropuccinia psidii MF-1]